MTDDNDDVELENEDEEECEGDCDTCECCGEDMDEVSDEEEAAWEDGFESGVEYQMETLAQAALEMGQKYTDLLEALFAHIASKPD